MRNYRVFYKDAEENEYNWDITANSIADASDACYYENSTDVDGYEETRIIEL